MPAASKPDLRPYFDRAWYVATYGGRKPLVRHWPWRYYCRRGWRKQHSPHRLFDAAWYLEQYPDVRAAGIEPLEHYVTYGWREGRQPCSLFDPAWYLSEYADVAAAGSEPLLHYLTQGWREGRCPHPSFNVAGYLAAHPEVVAAGAEPLAHFLEHGCLLVGSDPRSRLTAAARATQSPAAPRPPLIGPVNRGDVRAIAIYLPQFHRVKENDEWWGEGFTEWTNVRRGRPMFKGHYQPHVPHLDLGYYDLDDESVLERQAEMARRHGIHGFCFYHYWFDGRRILEKPLERLLASGRPDFPFCVCWANENWTRTWDGLDKQVLLAQRHSPESDERFLRDLLPTLRDPRYIHVEGLPLVTVYRSGLLDAPAATAERWRRIAEQEGLPGLYLACFQSFDRTDPRAYGFDAAIQFPPLQTPATSMADTGVEGVDTKFRGGVLDYREAMCHALARPAEPYPLFRGLMPSWDNTARRMERATVWTNSTPELYGRWLRGTIERMQREQPPERQLVFINAWNEWAEGAHLEPDTRHGYRYLEETAAALLPQPVAARATPAIPAFIPPVRHPAVWEHRRARLRLLFGRDVPIDTHGFLTEHVAALAGLAAGRHELEIKGGKPVCRIAGRLLPLDTPADLAVACCCAHGDRRPFAFVVLQYNQPEVTARCVAAIERLHGAGREIRIVVVDNGSEPAAVARSRELFAGHPCVTLLCSADNLGFARGNNLGYRHAREVMGAGYVAVINNDTVIDDVDFIARCAGIFAACPYSVLGPDIVTPDGRRENPWNDHVYDAADWRDLGELFTRQRAAWEAGGPAEFRRVGLRTPEAEGLREAVLQGAAYVLSPVFVADRESVFDERTFLYGEEFLLAVECFLAGHLTLYAPTVKILHEEAVSTATIPARRKTQCGYDAVIETAGWCRARLERHDAAVQGTCLSPDAPEIATLTADGRTHVLVDLFFSQPGPHGGGEYSKAVFKELVAVAATRGDVQLWAAIDPAQFIDDWVWERCRDLAVNVVAVTSFAEIATLVNTDCFDAFFAPAIVVYTGYEYMTRVGGPLAITCSRTRVVGTLLDVRDLELAADWERIALARREAGCTAEGRLSATGWQAERDRQRSLAAELTAMYRGICSHPSLDTLVTISDYSARSIRNRVGTDRAIEVLFAPEKDRPEPEVVSLPGIDLGCDQFAVCVNAGRIEKNAASAVAAFDRLCSDAGFAAAHPRLKLLLVGIGGLDDLSLSQVAHPERFVALPHLSGPRLEYLYREARFLLYPSFNEGFGYPPLEAMAYGTPSVVADNTAISQVCGTAVVTCDPFDVTAVAAAIRTVLEAPPPPSTLRGQLATVAARQKADLARLVAILCRRAVAAPARGIAHRARAA
jgi:GT2 family glycosyltransferase/glycosyltransferase involved in cell wall biosynthesis